MIRLPASRRGEATALAPAVCGAAPPVSGSIGVTTMAPRPGPIRTKRIYDPADPADGARVLIMRLWPRGVRKERADVWLKELGPVVPLLRAFLDGKIGWDAYVPRYLAGLERPEAREALAALGRLRRQGPVTLLCGCPDERRCHRSLLAAVLAGGTRVAGRGAPGERVSRPARSRARGPSAPGRRSSARS